MWRQFFHISITSWYWSQHDHYWSICSYVDIAFLLLFALEMRQTKVDPNQTEMRSKNQKRFNIGTSFVNLVKRQNRNTLTHRIDRNRCIVVFKLKSICEIPLLFRWRQKPKETVIEKQYNRLQMEELKRDSKMQGLEREATVFSKITDLFVNFLAEILSDVH